MEELKTGVTTPIAVVYGAFAIALVIASIFGWEVNGVTLNTEEHLVLPILLLTISIGVIRKTRWGRWLAYLISFPLLFVAPLGTFLAGYLYWHLTKYRKHFKNWI